MRKQNQDLATWYAELVALAKAKGVAWAVSNSPDDHADGFAAGDTPQEELQNTLDSIT